MVDKKDKSRAEQLDVRSLVDKVGGSQFDLIQLAVTQARRSSRTKSREQMGESSAVTALLDIQNDNVSIEEIRQVQNGTYVDPNAFVEEEEDLED